MDYNSATKQRFKELRTGADGKLSADWQLTDTKLLDAVKISTPPLHSIPIIFIPGIMGSNLADMKENPIWLLDSIKSIPMKLAWNWSPRSAGARQTILHPNRTKVYCSGAVPNENTALGLKKQDFLNRGWGEVSEASYGKFLLWLDMKMNASRNPIAWTDFSTSLEQEAKDYAEQIKARLQPGVKMTMHGLPDSAAARKINPITSDDLLKRAKSNYPVYAFGYNWLDNNQAAAELLKKRVEMIIKENNKGASKCTQVILVTHSMGGLVARACAQLDGMTQKIVGIVHGVMPAIGAAVAYRRCKVGMGDESFGAGLVIGSNGQEVTAVFAQSPGALQLLPSKDYGTNWLQISDTDDKVISSFPKSDPYSEIYLQQDRWWALINEEWLSPEGGKAINWDIFKKNIQAARKFHDTYSGKYHHNTFTFYGAGKEIQSYEKITWEVKKGIRPEKNDVGPQISEVIVLGNKDARTDGSNRLFIGGSTMLSTSLRGDASVAHFRETSFWEIRCLRWNSNGDGTVCSLSGRAPLLTGGANILQQFELSGVEHEPAFRDYPSAQIVTYYAITKLCTMADRS